MKRKIDSQTDDGELLLQAVKCSDVARVQELLKDDNDGAKLVNVKDDNGKYTYRYSHRGDTVLHIGCQRGNLEIVKLLVQKGADVHAKDDCGQKPFDHACFQRHLEAAKYLLENGAEIDAKRHDGVTPLYTACDSGHASIAKWLIENGANVNIKSRGFTALQTCCNNRYWRAFKLLVEYGADIHAKYDDGATVLHKLCEKGCDSGSVEMAKFAIANGADISAKDNHGRMPLFYAWKGGHRTIVKMLIQHQNVDLDSQDNDGKTLLHHSLSHHSLSHHSLWTYSYYLHLDSFPAKILVENGGNPNVKDNEGKVPLHFACRCPSKREIVEFLIDNGADPNVEDKHGMTPLHEACWHGHLDIVQLLLNRGANANAKSSRWSTPLHVASANNHLHIVWYLVRQHPWILPSE